MNKRTRVFLVLLSKTFKIIFVYTTEIRQHFRERERGRLNIHNVLRNMGPILVDVFRILFYNGAHQINSLLLKNGKENGTEI